MLEKQEIHCHSCSSYVQFDIDVELNGNHVLTCPKCGHEHCRVVTDGVITDARWDQRNGTWNTNTVSTNNYNVTQALTYVVSNVTYTTSSTYDTWNRGGTSSTSSALSTRDDTASPYMYDLWMNARSC